MKIVIDNTKSINEYVSKMNENDILYLKDGIYHEKVEILKNNIKIIGESKEKTIIANMDYFHKILDDYNECNTFRSYTVFIGADNVILENLTIKNESVPSSKYGQAVALHSDGNNLIFNNIRLESAQDTLFTGPLPADLIIRHQGFLRNEFLKGKKSTQIFNKCDIVGDVDFIFGCAQALFNRCNIISLNDSKRYIHYICAPAHPKNDKFGYLFYKCNIINEGKANLYYGRPWRDYGCSAFIDCYSKDITPEGFNNWTKEREKTARFYEYSPNKDLTKRVKWANILNKDEADKYVKDYLAYINYKEELD